MINTMMSGPIHYLFINYIDIGLCSQWLWTGSV
nr:MAG TPA: hypothetical protein [Caudoviricetes sp.]